MSKRGRNHMSRREKCWVTAPQSHTRLQTIIELDTQLKLIEKTSPWIVLNRVQSIISRKAIWRYVSVGIHCRSVGCIQFLKSEFQCCAQASPRRAWTHPSERTRLETIGLERTRLGVAMCHTFSVCLSRSAGSAIEAISLELHSEASVWHIASRRG